MMSSTQLQRAGLFLLVLLLPWQTHYLVKEGTLAGGIWEYGSIKLFAVDVLIVILAGLALWRGQSLKEYWRRAGAPLLLFLGIVFLSVSWAHDPQAAFYGWLRLVEGAILLLVLLRTRTTVGEALTAFAGSAVVQSIFALWQFFTQRLFASAWLGLAAHDSAALGTPVVVSNGERIARAFGSFSHPNILGGFLALGLIAALYLLAAARTSLQRLFVFAAIVLITSGLFVSFSRGAWMAAGVGALVLLFLAWRQHKTLTVDLGMRYRSRRVPLFTVVLAGGAVIAVTGAGFAVSFSNLVVSRLSAAGHVEERSVNERMQFTNDALTVFTKHWAAGVGVGNITPSVYEEVDRARESYDYQPPPNVFLVVLAELGVFGASIFLLVILEIVSFRGRGASAETFVVASLLCTLGILALFDHYLWTIPNGILLFWLMLGVCAHKERDVLADPNV